MPGSSFLSEADPRRRLVRFAFCKTKEVLAEAAELLRRFALGRPG